MARFLLKQKSVKRKPVSAAWLATFADLASLLITFFVLIFSTREVDKQNWSSLSTSLADTFSQQLSQKPKLFGGEEAQFAFLPAGNLTYLQAVLQQRFANNPTLKGADLTYNQQAQSLTITLPSALLFAVNDATLTPVAEQAIEQLATFLQHINNQITVAGHTDPSPVLAEGVYETNWELSALRAVSVLKKLRSSGVVAPMHAVGFADSRFFVVDSTLPSAVRYERARRVEVIISQQAVNAEERF